MKTKFIVFAAALLCVGAALSCKKQEPAAVSTDITIRVDESQLGEITKPDTYKAVFANTTTGESLTFEGPASAIQAKSVVFGVYDVTVSATTMTHNILGTLSKQTVDVNTKALTVSAAATKASALVFKEIFYACSKYNNGSKEVNYMKDNFFEIYNNSDITVYLDSLCIGATSNHNIASFSLANAAGNLIDLNGNDLGLKAEEYIAINPSSPNSAVWMIPGNGSTYPLAPGESAIIASSAMNHAAIEGAQSWTTPTVDLSTAEFETICQKYISKGQVDNPKAVDMVLYTPVNDNIANQYMPSVMTSGFVLFKAPVSVDKLPQVLNTANNTNKYVALPKSSIIDAVNWVKNESTDAYLPTDIDPGKIWVSGIYVGESIVRKSESTGADGIVKYQDTNNTSADFEVSTTPTIRRNGAKRPSWSN